MAEFTLPVDSDFILYRGWMARNTRPRRKTVSTVPASIPPARSSDKRRNTVTTSHFYKYSSRLSCDVAPLVHSPPQLPSPLPRPQTAFVTDSPHATFGASSPAEQMDSDNAHMTAFAPLSPPLSPQAAPLEPRKRSASALPVPQIPLPPIPEGARPVSSFSEDPKDSMTCIVLDNKKICLARPRLVQIRSPGSA